MNIGVPSRRKKVLFQCHYKSVADECFITFPEKCQCDQKKVSKYFPVN